MNYPQNQQQRRSDRYDSRGRGYGRQDRNYNSDGERGRGRGFYDRNRPDYQRNDFRSPRPSTNGAPFARGEQGKSWSGNRPPAGAGRGRFLIGTEAFELPPHAVHYISDEDVCSCIIFSF